MQVKRLRNLLMAGVACVLSAGVTWTVMRIAHLPQQDYVSVAMQARWLENGTTADGIAQVAQLIESKWGYDVRVLGGGRLDVRIPVYNGRPAMTPDEFRDANLSLSYAQLVVLGTKLSELVKVEGSSLGETVGPGRELVPLATRAIVLRPLPAIVNGGTQLIAGERTERIGETGAAFRGVAMSRGVGGRYEVRWELYSSVPEVGEMLGRFLDAHKGKPLALCLGGKVVVAPLTAHVSQDSLVLNGNMSREQAMEVYCLLGGLTLPFRLFPAPVVGTAGSRDTIPISDRAGPVGGAAMKPGHANRVFPGADADDGV